VFEKARSPSGRGGKTVIEWTKILKDSDFSNPMLLLIDRYVEKGLSLSEIAREFNTTHMTVKNYLTRFGIPLRGRGGDNSTKSVNITYEDYVKMTYEELAKKYEVSLYTVWSRTRGFPSKRGK